MEFSLESRFCNFISVLAITFYHWITKDLATTAVNSRIWGIKQILVSNKISLKIGTRFICKSDELLQLSPLHSSTDVVKSTAQAAKEKNGFPILRQPSEADSPDKQKVAKPRFPQPENKYSTDKKSQGLCGSFPFLLPFRELVEYLQNTLTDNIGNNTN